MIDLRTYTRRPYEVRAIEVTADNMDAVIAWAERNGGEVPWHGTDVKGEPAFSLYGRGGDWQEGTSELHVIPGLFVVQGPGGGFEVYKPDEFQHVYDDPSVNAR